MKSILVSSPIPYRVSPTYFFKHTRRAFSTSASHLKQHSIPAAYYRGGTSRAIIFHKKDLPFKKRDWDPIFRAVIGSPDPNGRQLDGMGGGISSLSKICVVAPSAHPDAQVEFTFVQVEVKNSGVDYSGNCGNMTSAIGPFAVDSGMIPVKDDYCGPITVRLYNSNTKKLIHSTFNISDGEAVVEGDFAIDGVSGTAAKVQLDFVRPGGSKTGNLLPTGNVVDTIAGFRVTCIDVGNPCVFIAANDLGINGNMLPDQIDSQPKLLSRLEEVRRDATLAMGIARTPEEVPASIPKICFVSAPSAHRLLSGELLDPANVDVVVRAISTGQPHKALPITSGLSVSAAAKLRGSIVYECLKKGANKKAELTIGHPSGKLVVGASYNEEGTLEKSTVYRTARRLMRGTIFWKAQC